MNPPSQILKLLLLTAFAFPAAADFRFSACCSANGGVCGCEGGGAICCDGKASTCACDPKNFHPSPKETAPVPHKKAAPMVIPAEHLKFLPDKKLTPGDFLSRSKDEICGPGFIQKVGRTPQKSKDLIFERFRIARRSAYEIDHLASKGLGGSNDLKNLYPQPRQALWNVQKKDQLENLLHRLVCSGKIPLGEAQEAIVTDWIGAYKKYIGDESTPISSPKKKKKFKTK
jgi:hypothetical protein